ncbi:disulfide bond formation protein B [Campylobacter sp. 47389-21]|nr:disulfide bond formation protein B [Campylobacter magnus]MDO2407117.1 disulfide bond formation protein B [Campylobacter magnus]
MVIISAWLVVTSHSFFQNYLYMRPCEQCVYIRFAFFVYDIRRHVSWH